MLILKIKNKNIILICLQVKYTLKNNLYHNLKITINNRIPHLWLTIINVDIRNVIFNRIFYSDTWYFIKAFVITKI